MPNKAGRFTPKEREFIKHMARTNDATYAATKAGYAFPEVQGAKMKANELIAGATRQQVQTWLYDTGGALGVGVLAEIAADKVHPANARRAAALDLAKLSGIGIGEEDREKDPSEQSAAEIERNLQRARQRLAAFERAASDLARPVLQHEESIPKSGAFD